MKCTLFIRVSQLVLLSSIFLPITALAQNKAPGISELTERAIKKNYDLANKQLDIQTSKVTQEGIKQSYIPTVEAGGKYAYVNSQLNVDLPGAVLPILNIPIFQTDAKFPTKANLWDADITAKMLLFSGFKVPLLSKAVGEKIKGETAMLEKDRQNIISEVSTCYDQIALLKQVKVVLEESSKRIAVEKKTAEKAFGYGLITSYELKKIDVAQALLASKQQEYEGKRSLVISKLAQLTGASESELELIDKELLPWADVLTTNTIENRSEINALNAAINANTFKIKAEKTYWLPKVQAFASIRYTALTDASMKTPALPLVNESLTFRADKISAFPTYFLGVGFKWELFDGFHGKHEVKKAKIELQKTENNKKQATELLTLNLKKANTDYDIANSQIKLKTKQQEVAQNALTTATKEYKLGLIKPSERIEAETDFQNAALDRLQAVFNQRQAAMELLKATSSLTVERIK